VREQPVISNANAKAPGNPPQKQRDKKSLPREDKERGNRAYVECDHEKSGELPDRLPKRSIPLEKIHECESPWWSVLACSFDSSLPAGARTDCNTSVIVGSEGQERTNWVLSQSAPLVACKAAFTESHVSNAKGLGEYLRVLRIAIAGPSRWKDARSFTRASMPRSRAKLEQSRSIFNYHSVGLSRNFANIAMRSAE